MSIIHIHPNHLKADRMNPLRAVTVLLLFFLMGCDTLVTMTERGKMDEYGRTMDSYETAMQHSDFNSACQYVDPEVMGRGDCMQRYENLKIASYDVLAANVADDKREVGLAVEVKYFLLDNYVLKKIQFEQSWRYKEDENRWLLYTEPPVFGP